MPITRFINVTDISLLAVHGLVEREEPEFISFSLSTQYRLFLNVRSNFYRFELNDLVSI